MCICSCIWHGNSRATPRGSEHHLWPCLQSGQSNQPLHSGVTPKDTLELQTSQSISRSYLSTLGPRECATHRLGALVKGRRACTKSAHCLLAMVLPTWPPVLWGPPASPLCSPAAQARGGPSHPETSAPAGQAHTNSERLVKNKGSDTAWNLSVSQQECQQFQQ